MFTFSSKLCKVTLTLCVWHTHTHTQEMLPICHLQNISIHFKLSQKHKCSVYNVGKLQLLGSKKDCL